MGCDAAEIGKENPQVLSNNNNFMYQCVTMSGKVANYETDIVIDSGSGITVMSLECFNLIKKYAKTSLEISCNDMIAKTATGESLEVVGTTCVDSSLIGQS